MKEIKQIFDFQKFKTIRSFGIYSGILPVDDTLEEQVNLNQIRLIT